MDTLLLMSPAKNRGAGEGLRNLASLDSIHVLHVDDEPDFAEVAAEFMERQDPRVEVETALNASDGLDKIQAHGTHCVVSDYDMPGRNGIEFLEAVREDHPNLPFILFTVKDADEVASEAISRGVTDYVKKDHGPSQYEILHNRIENAVDQFRTQEAIAETFERDATIGKITDGETVPLSGATQDTTQRKRRELALEESDERIEEFVFAVSHDLREPLGTVARYLQLLERRYEEELDEDAREFIDFAVDGATRMEEMIDGLVTAYSPVESGGDPFEPLDLDTVLDGVLVDLDEKIDASDAEITREPLPVVTGNLGQVRQLMLNLVDNAIKYAGDEPPRVHITAEQNGDMHQIAISDEGIGIEPEATDEVFDVFSRVHADEAYAGTGIGLALCKRIVERYGGNIWVESTPGSASTFYFTLPAAT